MFRLFKIINLLINCIKIQNSGNDSSSFSTDLAFYLLCCQLSAVAEKKFELVELFFQSHVKTCGLVQQLILRILRDLI